jgi:hypothetical protein
MICKAPAVGGLAVQAVAGRTGVCGIPGAQMRGHSTPRTKTCPWGPGPGAPILEGLRSVPPATRLTWTWRSTRQPVWRPALPYRAGDRRYLIVQETGATLSCRRPALLYRAGDRRYLIVQESGATLSCRRPALPYRAGERRYLIVQDTGATLSCRIPALPYRAGYRRYLIVQETGATFVGQDVDVDTCELGVRGLPPICRKRGWGTWVHGFPGPQERGNTTPRTKTCSRGPWNLGTRVEFGSSFPHVSESRPGAPQTSGVSG